MTKLTRKAFSLAVACFVAFTSTFGSTSITANANEVETSSDVVTTMADASEETYNVTFTAPESWTGTIYAYAYYDETAEDGSISTVEPLGYWPGTAATPISGNTYSITVSTSVGSVNMIFASITGEVGTEVLEGSRTNEDGSTTITYYYACSTEAQLPLDGEGGYTVNSDADISSDGTVTPVTVEPTSTLDATPTITETPEMPPSATPIAEQTEIPETTTPTFAPTLVPTVEPVVGPQVSVDVPNGTSYHENDSDTLPVTLSLIEGATSATYSIDNGPETTITETTTVAVGEGKIANSSITLIVKSTDGTTTNTQTFHYYKQTSVSLTTVTTLSTTMVKLFDAVSNASAETLLSVHFTPPETEEWTGTDISVYCYAYYDITDEETGETTTEKPLDIWPGTKMEEDTNGYSISVATKTGSVKIMFVSVRGELGEPITEGRDEPGYDFDQVAQLPDGYVYDEEGNKIQNPETGNDLFAEGVSISTETWFAVDADGNLTSTSTTAAPVSPTPDTTETPTPSTDVTAEPTPTATINVEETASVISTATPEMDAFFGASLSAPQYNTTTQILSAVVVNAKNSVTYTFSVDGTVIGEPTNNSYVAWNPSSLSAGTHIISVTITDGVTTKILTKNYTLVENSVSAATTPAITSTPIVTPVVSATAIVATTEPIATEEVITTPAVENTPSAVPTVIPTDVPATSGSSIVSVGAVTTTETAVKGTISFNKTGKTVGETVKVSVKITTGSAVTPYTYTFRATKSGSTKRIVKNTTKKSASWVPTAKGTYKITVLVYDANGKKVATLTKNYKVKKRVITVKNFKTNKKSPQKRSTSIVISANATTTAGKIRYKFVVKNSKGKTVASKSYSTKAKKTWKPKKVGTYTITLYVKNKKGVVVSKVKTFKIK